MRSICSQTVTSFKTASRFSNDSVYAGVGADWFDPAGEQTSSDSLDHPLSRKERKQALAEFGFPEEITHDEFNRQTGD
ncbi:hypothetical protein [Paenibacillus azoreducens]|uniref:Uncharacterized protein n=1 Tax=Paenibacillus azoreducens TaxID=116718 RepID=A0A919YAT1_9BACL|nr:hypothetical protein [Paenibacillus azoreducens]GIO45575.1 hypothetical protein J34TS1_03400 [Paenibacillus azoreducens]